MLSIIYPYRDRDPRLLKNSFESLRTQTINKFEVYLVDFGSTDAVAKEVKILCENFGYHYKYCFTQNQPWNKSKALNYIIKDLSTEYCFVADADMIFHQNFVKEAIIHQEENKTIYFQVGFLEQQDDLQIKNFDNYLGVRKSTSEATGMSMFPVKILKGLRGFDEFYHFWGAEDTDIHVRIINAGFPVEFYDKSVLMLHQWHPSYRSRESEKLHEEMRVKGIVELNHQHLKNTRLFKTTKVNINGWGNVPNERVIEELEKSPVTLKISNEKSQVEDLLYGQINHLKDTIVKVEIRKDKFQKSPRILLKKLLRKKVPVYYSMKAVNDLVLLNLISFYRDNPYFYKVEEDGNLIVFGLKWVEGGILKKE